LGIFNSPFITFFSCSLLPTSEFVERNSSLRTQSRQIGPFQIVPSSPEFAHLPYFRPAGESPLPRSSLTQTTNARLGPMPATGATFGHSPLILPLNSKLPFLPHPTGFFSFLAPSAWRVSGLAVSCTAPLRRRLRHKLRFHPTPLTFFFFSVPL